MLKLILKQIRYRIPIITILMILTCIISTAPQFFFENIYSEVTSKIYGLDKLEYFQLPYFTHSPDYLINHLLGNILIFLVFGSLTEVLIGSRRISFIYLLTFISISMVNSLHSIDKNAGHGASGICWGLNIFFIFILLVIYENKGRKIFKDVFVIFTMILLVFSVFGIPIIEVIVLKYRFFQNFGQTLHLVSMVVVVPFVFIWRKEIERSVKKLLDGEIIETDRKKINLSMILVIFLMGLNLYGTVKMVFFTKENNKFQVKIEPAKKVLLKDIEKIMINFEKPMEQGTEKLRSISMNYETENPPLIYTRWIDDKNLEIYFSRQFIDNETLYLEYSAIQKIDLEIEVERYFVLNYK